MKKILFLTAILEFFVVQVSFAENRKWDFTSWSNATVANLIAGEDWSDIEKSDASAPTDISKENCFWEVSASGTSEGVTLTANGETITELEGLLYTNTTDRSLAIAVNYGDVTSVSGDGFGPYHGVSYLWFGSSKKNYFIIPNVKAGATIRAGVESHKLTDSRGINLYVGQGTSGTQLLSPSGESVSTPSEYEEQEWYVPVDLSDTPNEDGTYNIQIYNTNGCHIYFIEVNEDAPAVSDAKMAYIYDSTAEGYDADNDFVRAILGGNDSFSNVEIVDIDASKDVSSLTISDLVAYDVVIISSTLSQNSSLVSILKDAIAYVPVLNLNADLYSVWGYGTKVVTSTQYATVSENWQGHSLFVSSDDNVEYIKEDGRIQLLDENYYITGVQIPADGYFASDDMLALCENDVVAIHIHNSSRNAYIYLPYTHDVEYPEENSFYDILINAVTLLNYSKSDIPQALSPTFSESYNDLNTDVTISCGTSGATIYYTIDGTTPTVESTKYTGKVNISEANTTISAIAYADGYKPSDVSQFTVSIYQAAQEPEISVEYGEGKSIVSITTAEENGVIYYNITGSNSVSASSVYSSPIEITEYSTVTAFTAETETKVQSATVSKIVAVEGTTIRIDELAHFDANRTDWSNGETKSYYYTTGNKNGYNYYDVEESVVKGSDGEDSTVYIKTPLYVLTEYTPGNGWSFRSYGQGALWENNTASTDIDDTNTTARYRPETALDAGPSSYDIQFGNVQQSDGVENDPYSAFIMTTEKFKGPFDVVTFIGNASTSNHPKASVWLSKDTTNEENWVLLDSVLVSTTQRYIKKTRLHYEDEDEVFVKVQANFSSVQVFDIYIYNYGESSENATGIVEVKEDLQEALGSPIRTEVYNLNGMRSKSTAKGINLIKQVYADGTVKTHKVIVK